MPNFWVFNLSRLLLYAFCKLYFRIEFEGQAQVPPTGPVIVAPNHVSYLDPIWVSLPLRRQLVYMTWDRMTRLPLLGPLIRAFGAFPVNTEIGDRGALKYSLRHLRAAGGLVIFPEGSRTRDGRLQEFKPGVIKLALETAAPIVPVTINGGYRAFAPHHHFPRPYKVKIIYHAPITVTTPADASQAKQALRDEAARLQSLVATALPSDALPVPPEPEALSV